MGGRDMKCPYCACQDTRVIDSRDSRDLEAVRRRRQCVACGKRWTTYERFERPEPVSYTHLTLPTKA